MTKNEINIEEFTKKNNCSKKNLEKLFSKRIIKDIIKYTKKHAFPSWRKVNYKKRNGIKLNYFEQKFYDNISFAIRNFTLNEDCIVYRGFATNADDLKARGLMNENNEIVIGKVIPFEGLVSTSLKFKIAEAYAVNSNSDKFKNDVLLVYEIKTRQNTKGLPIYNLSSVKEEYEILFNDIELKIEGCQLINTTEKILIIKTVVV